MSFLVITILQLLNLVNRGAATYCINENMHSEYDHRDHFIYPVYAASWCRLSTLVGGDTILLPSCVIRTNVVHSSYQDTACVCFEQRLTEALGYPICRKY